MEIKVVSQSSVLTAWLQGDEEDPILISDSDFNSKDSFIGGREEEISLLEDSCSP